MAPAHVTTTPHSSHQPRRMTGTHAGHHAEGIKRTRNGLQVCRVTGSTGVYRFTSRADFIRPHPRIIVQMASLRLLSFVYLFLYLCSICFMFFIPKVNLFCISSNISQCKTKRSTNHPNQNTRPHYCIVQLHERHCKDDEYVNLYIGAASGIVSLHVH